MTGLLARWSALEQKCIGMLAGLAVLIELLVMTTRYLLPNVALGWAEQFVIYLVIWALWLSGSQLVEKGEFIQNDLLLQQLPRRWKRRVRLAGAVCGLGFCAALCWGGAAVVHFAWTVGERSEGGITVPLALYYLSVPVGTLLMCGKYALVGIWRWNSGDA